MHRALLTVALSGVVVADAAAQEWRRLFPPIGVGNAIVHDLARQRTVLVGGTIGTVGHATEVWEFDRAPGSGRRCRPPTRRRRRRSPRWSTTCAGAS